MDQVTLTSLFELVQWPARAERPLGRLRDNVAPNATIDR
jgi:hypothetical protein